VFFHTTVHTYAPGGAAIMRTSQENCSSNMLMKEGQMNTWTSGARMRQFELHPLVFSRLPLDTFTIPRGVRFCANRFQKALLNQGFQSTFAQNLNP
jgi:hypothetical protein